MAEEHSQAAPSSMNGEVSPPRRPELLPPEQPSMPLSPASAGLADTRNGMRNMLRGAKERTKWIEYYLGRGYSDPMAVLLEIMSRPVADLAIEFQCSVFDAMTLQATCARELMPFFHQREPPAVQTDGKPMVALTIVDPEKTRESGKGGRRRGWAAGRPRSRRRRRAEGHRLQFDVTVSARRRALPLGFDR